MKILAQRPTHISAVATVLLMTKTFTVPFLERERETDRDRDRETERQRQRQREVLKFAPLMVKCHHGSEEANGIIIIIMKMIESVTHV